MPGTEPSHGERIRRKVLGDEHVARSLENANDFTEEFQKLATDYCWGAIWTRDGIDLKTRSLINIGMLAALGRMHELSMHVGGALRNGATPDEIKEVLLQASIYCGIPAGNDAFRVASRVLADAEHKDQ